ncbi:MAG: dipeptidase, partial [Pseudomonadales bacterium]|nr:dipeptidase [Pseudomonadales bacterium]
GYLYDSKDTELDTDIRQIRRASGITEDYLYPFELYWEIDDEQEQQKFLGAVSGRLGPGSVATMVNHIDYIVDRIGIDHVGIGTDFNHGSGVAGFRDASEAMNVTAELLRRGYSQAAIEKIWGANFLRVMRAASTTAH